MALRLYWLTDKTKPAGQGDRNTPVVASSAKQAKEKSRRPATSKAKVYDSRAPTAEERKKIKSGKWITAKAPRKKSKGRGYGPKPKRKKR